MSRLASAFIGAALAGVTLGAATAAPRADEAPAHVLVFAAASLQTALDAVSDPLERATGIHLTVSYAASSALARQIESGAPADLFISADLDWMDELAGRHLIRAASRVDLLTNQLVLIAPRASPVALSIAPGFRLATALGPSRLALADPAGVPAGKYAKAALTALGVWPSVADRVAPAADVRAALQLVARGEARLGIVYRTDALAEPAVSIVDTFPASTHAPIIYPVAITTAAPDAAAAEQVLTYLRSAAARRVFTAQGFTMPDRE